MCHLCVLYKGYLFNKYTSPHRFVLKIGHSQCLWNCEPFPHPEVSTALNLLWIMPLFSFMFLPRINVSPAVSCSVLLFDLCADWIILCVLFHDFFFFTQHEIHPCWCTWLWFIHFYPSIIFYYMKVRQFIHSRVDGFALFRVLAVTNTTTNIILSVVPGDLCKLTRKYTLVWNSYITG